MIVQKQIVFPEIWVGVKILFFVNVRYPFYKVVSERKEVWQEKKNEDAWVEEIRGMKSAIGIIINMVSAMITMIGAI